VERPRRVNVQPSSGCWNQTAGITLPLVQQPLRLEDQRIGERKIVRHLDPALVLPLAENERMYISRALRCLVLGCGSAKVESGLCAGRGRRQRRLLDLMPSDLLRPPSSRGDRNIVSVTELS
jgi:hypothetical protein